MPTMLPSTPKTLGRLSDVFASCLGAITGEDNRLSLRKSQKSLAILVDGLGTYNIKAAGGHAYHLNRALLDSHPIHAGFPSTTATSITSFGTGLTPGEHGIVGYKVLDPNTGEPLNQLTGWSASFNPLEWQPNQTIAELALVSGCQPYAVGPAEYANSGFTALTMRGAKYVPAKTIRERFDAALSLLAEPTSSLVYLYVPELDQRAHAYGVDSVEWLAAIEELDSSVALAANQIEQRGFKDVGMLLTADHGIVDVPHSSQLYLDEFELPNLKLVGGDPRANYLYLADTLSAAEIDREVDRLQAQLNVSKLGRGVRVASKEQIINAGWFGPTVSALAASRMPEIFAITFGRTALYHRDFAPAKSLKMIGQHGSVSPEELAVPLIRFGAFR